MKKNLQTLIVWIGAMACLPVLAGQARQLSWEDLIPARLVAEDPLADLTREQKELVYWVINTMDTLPGRSPETEEYFKEVDEAMPSLEKAGIDIVEILAKRKELRTAVNEKLSGEHVRIPGYLLPLELSGSKVTEFLLVPYVGACIHVPPPPPNQIVHVKVVQKEGYKNGGLFEPVWVTGKIDAKTMAKELYLVDGSADVDIGYVMKANHVEPYR